MPGAPGMLSTASPRRAITSTTFSGGTPRTSTTLAGSRMRLSFCGLRILTAGVTSCIMSLSPETMKTSCCLFGGLAGQGADDVVGLKALGFEDGNAQGFEGAANVGNLAAQILGHGFAIGLVALVADLVEGSASSRSTCAAGPWCGRARRERLRRSRRRRRRSRAARNPGAAS